MNINSLPEFFNLKIELLLSQKVKYNDILFAMGNDYDSFLKNLKINFPVEIKESKIQGRGVFATSKIRKGDLVTFYPCHLILYQNRQTARTKFIGELLSDDILYSYGTTQCDEGPELISMVGNPNITNNPGYLAHMMNDALPPNLKINKSPKTSEALGKSWILYEATVQAKINAILIRKKYYTYAKATRDIEIGEEILISYGYPYWAKVDANRMNVMGEEFLLSLPEGKRQYVINLLCKSLRESISE